MKFRFQFENKTSYIRVNRRGTIYILLTIGIGFAATNTMNNLLYIVVSFLLSIMGISGVFARKNLSNIEFSVIPPPEIYRLTPAPFKVRLKSLKGKKFNIFVELSGKTVGIPVLSDEVEITLPITFKSRGKMKIDRIKFSSSFPFGFFTREEIYDLSLEFLVYPRIYSLLPGRYLYGETSIAGSYSNLKPGTGGDFLGLRKYIEGDPVKLIHWKASSRELVTKVFSGPSSNQVILKENDLQSKDFEDMVDEIASLAVALLKSGYSVGIEFKHLHIAPAPGEEQRIKILSRLAML